MTSVGIDMYRRELLASVGSVTVAGISGCLGRGSDEVETEGDDDRLIDSESESLLLTVERVESQLDSDWESITGVDERPLMFRDAELVRGFVPETDDDESTFREYRTMSGVWIHESVESARENYDESPFQFGHGLEEQAIAVESVGGFVDGMDTRVHEWGYVLFRDANVVGAIGHHNGAMNGEAVIRDALELAAAKHERWRS